jgi:hypothetical protein
LLRVEESKGDNVGELDKKKGISALMVQSAASVTLKSIIARCLLKKIKNQIKQKFIYYRLKI